MKSGLQFTIPRHVFAAAALFIAVQALALSTMPGVRDLAGTLLNTSKPLSFNTYEDDGAINVYAALGYFKDHSNRFSYLINIGGPALHLAGLAVSAADSLGLVKRFKDPLLYLMYPDEFLNIWKFLGYFKLLLFTAWLPLVVYWIGANHFSKRTGTLACWLAAVMPFTTGFEIRMKFDAAAIVLMLLSLLFQLDYLKRRNRRSLYLAAAFLGFSLSVKLVALSALATFFLVYALAENRRPPGLFGHAALTRLILPCALMLGVFLLANPLFIAGLADFIRALMESKTFFTGSGGAARESLWAALAFRFAHFSSFYGQFPGLAVFPALALSVLSLLRKRRFDANAVFLAAIAVDVAYTSLVAGGGVRVLTYYYFPLAILLLFPIASFLDACMSAAERHGRLAGYAACGAVLLLVAHAFGEDAAVLSHLRSETNRQAAHAWIEENAGLDASVGVPLEPGEGLVNSRIRVDPFRYRLVQIGKDGRLLETKRPAYALWTRNSPDDPRFDPEGYLPAAIFMRGGGLPHERYDLYQEEPFSIFKAEAPVLPPKERGPGALEKDLGDFVRKDPEAEFNILQYQALGLFPISLDILRKAGETVALFPAGMFTGAVRDASSPLAFAHQADPSVLTLWGIKYVLARNDGQGGFEENVLRPGLYPLREAARLPGDSGGGREAVLYGNERYAGQGFFLSDPAPEAIHAQAVSFNWSRPWRIFRASLPGSGTLYPPELIEKHRPEMLRIRMEIKADGPMDLILKGGKSRQSALIGPGRRQVDLPYELGPDSSSVEYEMHPAGHDGSGKILSASASPLRIEGGPTVRNVTANARFAFAWVDAQTSGRVAFALPAHRFWRAEVDGEEAPVQKDVANIVSVPVTAGRRFVSLRFE